MAYNRSTHSAPIGYALSFYQIQRNYTLHLHSPRSSVRSELGTGVPFIQPQNAGTILNHIGDQLHQYFKVGPSLLQILP
jgi:hypothetical protein